jgi:hypothetical protein
MWKRSKCLLFVLLLLPIAARAQQDDIKVKMAQAAHALLLTLSSNQYREIQYSFADSERLRWSNQPQNLYPSRVGLRIDEMNRKQKRALHHLLQTVLSEQGYLKAMNVMRLDAYLHQKASDSKNHEGSGKYWLVFFGKPDTAQAWSWRFEGHHLSLNFTSTSSGISCTPMFFGSDPAIFPEGNLAGWENQFAETQVALQFYHSLSSKQQNILKISPKIPKAQDVLARTGKEHFLQKFRGISFGELNLQQQNLLKRLVKIYFHNLNPLLAAHYLKKLHWNKLFIGWWGSHQPGHPFYYRIHGPNCIIEYCSRLNDPDHIHTLVRFLPTDFGGLH